MHLISMIKISRIEIIIQMRKLGNHNETNANDGNPNHHFIPQRFLFFRILCICKQVLTQIQMIK